MYTKKEIRYFTKLGYYSSVSPFDNFEKKKKLMTSKSCIFVHPLEVDAEGHTNRTNNSDTEK